MAIRDIQGVRCGDDTVGNITRIINDINSLFGEEKKAYERARGRCAQRADVIYALDHPRDSTITLTQLVRNGDYQKGPVVRQWQLIEDTSLWRHGGLYLPRPDPTAASVPPQCMEYKPPFTHTLILNPLSVEMALRELADVVADIEQKRLTVSVHNIRPTFGNIHACNNGNFDPLFSPDFRTYHTDDTPQSYAEPCQSEALRQYRTAPARH